MADFDIVAAAQTQRPQLPPGWQPDVQRLLSDIVPLLSAEQRHTFRELVKSLKAKRDAREIPCLSAALMEQAPQVVGADLWQQCIDRQREEAAQQAEAPAGPTDGAASQQERNADAAGPPPRGKNLVKVAGALKKRALEERDEADANAEKKQKTLAAIAKEYICPITLMLPTEPVKAEDGHTYERKAIEGWLAQNATSPVTRAHMGPRLMEDYAAKNTIETLVNSGDIDDELAEAWKQKLAEKLEDEKVVKEWRAKAEGGDEDAMYRLGVFYEKGQCGLAIDEAQARAWYELSGAARNPKGMASFGQCLLLGIGGPEDHVLGLVNTTEAAHLGSDWGAYRLGWAFFEGAHGLPKDPVRARYWLKKVVDGECTHKHLTDQAIAEAANWLRELDQ